jgi:hypothetical protein
MDLNNNGGEIRGGSVKVNGLVSDWLKIVVLLLAIIASHFNLKADVRVLETKIIMMEKQLDRIEPGK